MLIIRISRVQRREDGGGTHIENKAICVSGVADGWEDRIARYVGTGFGGSGPQIQLIHATDSEFIDASPQGYAAITYDSYPDRKRVIELAKNNPEIDLWLSGVATGETEQCSCGGWGYHLPGCRERKGEYNG